MDSVLTARINKSHIIYAWIWLRFWLMVHEIEEDSADELRCSVKTGRSGKNQPRWIFAVKNALVWSRAWIGAGALIKVTMDLWSLTHQQGELGVEEESGMCLLQQAAQGSTCRSG